MWEGLVLLTEAQKRLEGSCWHTYQSGYKITEWPALGGWRGVPCFIVGGGPSLRGFDFNKLAGKRVIGINKSFLYCKSEILYFMDHSFYNDPNVKENPVWRSFSGVKCTPSPYSDRQVYGFDVRLVRRRIEPIITRDIEEGIYAGSNSGTGALCLAVALGCNPIYLLGYDFSVVGGTHWHEGYGVKDSYTCERSMREYLEDFVLLAPLIKLAGVKVVNLNPNSALREFEFSSLLEVFG